MAHVLHLIKDPTNRVAFETVSRQARDPDHRVTVVLLHEATAPRDAVTGHVFRLDEGPAEGRASPYPAITHAELLDLIFAADTVVSW
jgi:hypothetical protein